MNEHKEKIVNGDRAAALLEKMAAQPAAGPSVAPIGIRAETAARMEAGARAFALSQESRNALEAARMHRVNMEYAAAHSRALCQQARTAIATAFGGTAIGDALIEEVRITEQHLDEIPMPKPAVPAPAGSAA